MSSLIDSSRFVFLALRVSLSLLIATTFLGPAEAASCSPLSDRDFYQAAASYSLNSSVIPEKYRNTSVDELLRADPDCCSVDRDDHVLRQPVGFLSWLFPDTSVLITMLLPSGERDGTTFLARYLSTPCGEIGEIFGNRLRDE